MTASPGLALGAADLPGADWRAAHTQPGAGVDVASLDELTWLAARVPGTAAGVLADAGLWKLGESCDFDAEDWWFRTSFEATAPDGGEETILHFGGIATVADIYLNGILLLQSDSMFASHALDVGKLLQGDNTLAIHCHALRPLLAVRRRPRARWRTRLVDDGNLRFFRTMLLGRAPGFAPGPAAVGPWRPVTLERRRGVAIEAATLRPHIEGSDGILTVSVRVRNLGDRPRPQSVEIELAHDGVSYRGPLSLEEEDDGALCATGALRVADAALWWPHTHGEPVLYQAALHVDEVRVPLRAVGFRALRSGPLAEHDFESDGLTLHVNNVAIFARGAVWTPLDAVGLAPSSEQLRAALMQVCAAGMNIVRLPGTGAYESAAFHDLCDELGILVWQDFMFANLDYPLADDAFRASVEREAAQQLSDLAGRPSLAVLCGNSEIEQQVAMFGLDPALGRGELFGELLPGLIRAAGADAVYVPSAPCGGDMPFRPDRGVANYYGVGGYRLPLEDARRSGVRFAAECLAFANVPHEETVEELLGSAVAVHHPRWKAGVPRDVGTGWDFDDVRDHYLGVLFDLDPGELRRFDHERYLELSRAVTGEVMAEVFGEWRRRDSTCSGGIVLWLRDLVPGAGWGLIDHRGKPKVAYHHVRRALAPVAVWTTDEGLGGVVAHVANDRPATLHARLRIALLRDLEQPVGEAEEVIAIPPHGTWRRGVEELLGRFVDVSWRYRFGPPAQDAVIVSLEDEANGHVLSQVVRFPAGRPMSVEPAERLGLLARAHGTVGSDARLVVSSARLAYGVRIHAPDFAADDDAFSVAPGSERTVRLAALSPEATLSGATVTALNLRGRVRIEIGEP